MRAAQRIFFADARQRKRLAGKTGQQHLVIGDRRVDMAIDSRLVAQAVWLGYQADISIEAVLLRIAVVIRLVGAHRLFVPLAGKNALSADGVEAAADAADAREEIDKAKQRVVVVGRTRRQQSAQQREFAFAQRRQRAFVLPQTGQLLRRPVVEARLVKCRG